MKITVSQIRNSRIKEVLSNMCFNSQPQNTKNIWFAPKTQTFLWPAPRADPEGPTTGSRPQKRHSPASRTVHSGWSALDEETSTQTSEYEKRQTAMQKVFRVFADVKVRWDLFFRDKKVEWDKPTFTPHSFTGQSSSCLRSGHKCEYWRWKFSAMANSRISSGELLL